LPVSVDLIDRDLAIRAGAAVHVLVADDGHGCLPYVWLPRLSVVEREDLGQR